MNDQYQTIQKAASSLFKDRGSKFYGYVFPATSEDAVKAHLQQLREQHQDARHHCYGFRLGAEGDFFRYSDDGEPNNSAGKPIYGQLLSFEVTNVLAVVVRYFGGTKLGVGGLINAYKEATKLALQETAIETQYVQDVYEIRFTYEQTSEVMRLQKALQLEIIEQVFESDCLLKFGVRTTRSAHVLEQFTQAQFQLNHLTTM